MNIKQDLIALKDQSELMLDLAYSAMFLHDHKIAKQVKGLYFSFQEILKRIKKRVFEDQYLSDMVVHLHEIASNAAHLACLAENDKVPKVVKDVLSTSDTRVIEELVSYSSFFVGKTVGELKVRSHTKARIVAVKRNDIWMFNIDKNFRFRQKDLIVAVGTKRSAKLLKLAVGISKLEK